MEKRRKRNRKRRLLVLIIALFFTTIMFTTTTYAWFTANQTVRVNTITVNVEAKNGIQISVDGTNWKSIVQTADITSAQGTYGQSVNQLPETLEPVSTIGTVDTTGKMEMFYGTVGSNTDGDYILTAEKTTETRGVSGKFIAFDLFFQVNAITPVYLSTSSGVRVSSTSDDTGIKNASRIAFVVLGNADSGETVPNIQKMGLEMTAQEAAAVDPIIWEPNYDVHTAAAVGHARDTYGVTTSETGGSLIPYQGVKTEIEATDNVLVDVSANGPTTYSTTFFDEVTIDKWTKSGAGFNENLSLLTLSEGITKIRIYMWVEGQDVDCENNASGGEITYDLVITTLSS